MSDKFDQYLEGVAHHLSRTYDALAGICEALPIPVILPTGEIETPAELIAPVARVAEICDSEPMPEEQQALLFNAVIRWIAAFDMIVIAKVFQQAHGDLRLMAADSNLYEADEALLDLFMWLADNR